MKNKILFIKRHDSNAKFVTNDIPILKSKYDVKVDEVNVSKSIAFIFTFTVKFFGYLFSLWRYDLVYIWFADYHSFLPILFSKLFRKKSIICAGGYESTYIPEIDMGVFTKATLRKRLRCFCASYSLKNCDLILPVDESLIEHENSYIYSDKPGKPILKDGIKNFVQVKGRFETVHLSYDSDYFKKNPSIKKEKAVVSVGLITNENEFRRKGFDVLVESSKVLTDTKFILAGLSDEYFQKLKSLNLNNLELYKTVSYDKLIELFSRAKVYSQLSLFEGMPSTICEAMLCECIPVGSSVNAIPHIIGDCGFVVHEKNIQAITKALSDALNADNSLAIKSRERIISLFSPAKRQSHILRHVDTLLKI